MLLKNNINQTTFNISFTNKIRGFSNKNLFNFLFLINNFELLSNLALLLSIAYVFVFQNSKVFLSLNAFRDHSPHSLIISKPYHKRYKKLNMLRVFLRNKRNMPIPNFKFSKFFHYNNVYKSKNVILNTTRSRYYFYPQWYPLYKNIKKKFWHFLVGGLISQFYWEFNAKRMPPVSSYRSIFLKNFRNFNLKVTAKTPRISIFAKNNNNNLFLRKLYITNFFYANKLNMKYNNLRYFLMLRPILKKKRKPEWHLLRPYLFMNNNTITRLNHKTQNQTFRNLFKFYSKSFNLLKKSRYTPKRFNNINFIRIRAASRRLSKFWFKTKSRNKPFFIKRFSIFRRRKTNRFFYRIKRKKFRKHAILIRRLWRIHLRRKVRSYSFFKWVLNINRLLTKNLSIKKLWGRFFLRNRRNRRKVKKIKKTLLLHNFININKFFLNKNLKFKKFRIKFKKKINKIIKNSKNLKNISILFKQPSSNNYARLPAFPLFSMNKRCFSKKITLLLRIKKFTFNNNFILHNYKLSEVYLNFLNPVFLSKEKTPFSLSHLGFIYLTETLTSILQIKLTHTLKKLIYSFAYKNEVQTYVLRKYTKNNFISNFYHLNNMNIRELANSSLLYRKSSFFNPSTPLSTTTQVAYLLTATFPSKKWTYFSDQFNYWKNLSNEIIDFNIRRVKFKPGYMTQWRDARSVLKLSMGLKMRYQYRLTRYLSKYNKFTRFKTFLILEMQLLNILIKSRLLPDNSLVLMFIQNNLIFLNGAICNNLYFQIFTGDFMQLMITLKYYILYRWFANWTLRKKNRLKRVLKRKSMSMKDTEEKKKSFLLPKWILFSKNALDDVSKFLEVDYFTLSFIVLYEPFQWSELNYYNILNTRFSVINLYNWKYIT